MTKIDTQPKALRLADWLEEAATTADMGRKPLASDHRRRAAAELRRLHAENAAQAQQIAQVRADAARKTEQLNKLLAHCPDGECYTCSTIICPHACELHFHHDGCPACAEHDAAASGAAQGDDHDTHPA